MSNFFFGTVAHGLGKGNEFGFPTVNIKLINKKLHIDNGVYAAQVIIHKKTYKGMLYAGTRPTLGLHKKTIEIHILDYNENLYNKQISFQILHKIRDEIHFDSIEKLIENLHHDKEMVYNFFKNFSMD